MYKEKVLIFCDKMSFLKIKRKLLCEWLWMNSNSKLSKIIILIDEIRRSYPSLNENQLASVKKQISRNFLHQYNRKWSSARRTRSIFEKKFDFFLNSNELLITEDDIKKNNPSSRKLRSVAVETKKDSQDLNRSKCEISTTRGKSKIVERGRPMKAYENLSKRSKRYRSQILKLKFHKDELQNAVRGENKMIPINNTKHVNDNSDLALNKTLAMYMDLGLSKSKFELLRSHNLEMFGSKMYPPYGKIQIAKQKCYPNDVAATKYGASVKLQSLLNHTVERIFQTLFCEIHTEHLIGDIVLYGKWGMDGASDQQTFKQGWADDDDSQSELTEQDDENVEKEANRSDKSIFIISYVPLQMKNETNNIVLWKNYKTSSVRYCRPIKFEFVKETKAITTSEYTFYKNEIQLLVPSETQIHSQLIKVHHNLQCTMIDGKVCNVLTNQNSSASCNICGATPIQMNDLEKLRKMDVREENYR